MSFSLFEQVVHRLVDSDARYRPEAYFFVRDALNVAAPVPGAGRRLGGHHVSAAELLRSCRDVAVEEYGPLARVVLEEWGIRSSADIGQVVFALIDAGVFGKREEDRLEDFENAPDLAAELDPFG